MWATLTGAAARLKTLGLHVVGVSRHGNPVDEVDEMLAVRDLDQVLPRADFVFMATPYTPETNNLMDARRLALLPNGAGIVNVGRAATMVDALVAGLNSGRIGGAVLDVFDPEPLRNVAAVASLT